MKKLIFLSVIFSLLLTTVTGCEKEKKIENKLSVEATTSDKNDAADTGVSESIITSTIENYEEKESPQLFVEYTDDTPFTKESCDFYSVEQSEYSTMIVFTTDGVLQDLKLLSLFMNDVDEEGNPEYSIDEIYSYGTLESYRPLMVELTFYGDMPSYGVSYTDETGETRYFAVSVSGYDGSLELLEF